MNVRPLKLSDRTAKIIGYSLVSILAGLEIYFVWLPVFSQLLK
jgi:hypothetical protein